jgi:hypothetical protein
MKRWIPSHVELEAPPSTHEWIVRVQHCGDEYCCNLYVAKIDPFLVFIEGEGWAYPFTEKSDAEQYKEKLDLMFPDASVEVLHVQVDYEIKINRKVMED